MEEENLILGLIYDGNNSMVYNFILIIICIKCMEDLFIFQGYYFYTYY